MNKRAHIQMVPDGYTAVTPWIISKSTDKMIAFLQQVFDAAEVPNSRIKNEQGQIIHAVVKVSDATIMLFDAREGWGSTPAFLNFYVGDVESVLQQALEAGATVVTDITTLWFGEKVCRILDPFGNLFWINERVEEVDLSNGQLVHERASSPVAIQGIAYIQQSLHDALIRQKELLTLS